MNATTVKHTPGPWTDISDWENAHRQDGMALVTTPNSKQAIDCTHSGATFEEDLANARLIAAAPQLLEALELLHRIALQTPVLDNPDDREIIDQAWAAIRLATGESQ